MTDNKFYWLLMLLFWLGQGYQAMPDSPEKNLYLFGIITIATCCGQLFDRWKTKVEVTSMFSLPISVAEKAKDKAYLRQIEAATLEEKQAEKEPIRRWGSLGVALTMALLCLLFAYLASRL